MKIILIALLLFISSFVKADEESVFMAELVAEGARSPLKLDVFKGNFPYGLNEITPMGLRQHYLIGYDLRTNYADALGLDKVYSPWQVNIRSTNHNATLMGAQAGLEALFPPDTRGPLTENQAKLAIPPGDTSMIKEDIKKLGNNIMPLNFQTLPIHAFDFDKDDVLMGDWCSEIYEINNRTVNDAEWETQIEEKYKEALTALRTFLENEKLTIHELYQYIDAFSATLFQLQEVKDLKKYTKEILAFGFEYLEKYWSDSQSSRIFSNGFLTDLDR